MSSNVIHFNISFIVEADSHYRWISVHSAQIFGKKMGSAEADSNQGTSAYKTLLCPSYLSDVVSVHTTTQVFHGLTSSYLRQCFS